MHDEIAGTIRPAVSTRVASGPTDQPGPLDGALPGAPPPLPSHLMPSSPTFSDGIADTTSPAPGVAAPSTAVSIVPMPHPETSVATTEPSSEEAHDVLRRQTWLPRLAWFALVLLVIGLGAAAVSFRGSARQQTERAEAAEVSLASVEADLASTTDDLTSTTGELATVTSRADDLEQRVSEVQDERNAAEEVSRLGATAAAQMLECRDLLLDAMSSLVSGSMLYPNYAGLSARLDAAVPVCQSANSSVDAFITATQ